LIGRFISKSLQKSFAPKKDKIHFNKIPNGSDENFLHNFYDFHLERDIIYREYIFHPNGDMSRVVKSFNGYEWHNIEETKRVILVDGVWRSGVSRYKIDREHIDIENIFRLKTENIREIEGNYTLQLREDTIKFSLPKGAKLYTNLIEQKKNLYRLNEEVGKIGLSEFIEHYSNKNWFDGFKYGGVSFGNPKRGDREGKLWYLNRVGKSIDVVSRDVGSWRVEIIDGVEILSVDVAHYDNSTIFANVGDYLLIIIRVGKG